MLQWATNLNEKEHVAIRLPGIQGNPNSISESLTVTRAIQPFGLGTWEAARVTVESELSNPGFKLPVIMM